MKKEIDISECVIEFNEETETTIRDELIELFVGYVNNKLGYVAVIKKV